MRVRAGGGGVAGGGLVVRGRAGAVDDINGRRRAVRHKRGVRDRAKRQGGAIPAPKRETWVARRSWRGWPKDLTSLCPCWWETLRVTAVLGARSAIARPEAPANRRPP